MNSKYIIFVSGLLASGKTTFSKYLSNELGLLLINKDYIKEILCETVGFSNREENLKLSEATHEIMRHVAVNCMKIGLPLILESNFNSSDAEYFSNEMQKYAYTPIHVVLTGDKGILYVRFMKRWKDRHWAHKSFDAHSENFKNDFFNQIEGWERFDISGEKIIIDTTNFTDVLYDDILEKINKLINKV